MINKNTRTHTLFLLALAMMHMKNEEDATCETTREWVVLGKRCGRLMRWCWWVGKHNGAQYTTHSCYSHHFPCWRVNLSAYLFTLQGSNTAPIIFSERHMDKREENGNGVHAAKACLVVSATPMCVFVCLCFDSLSHSYL